MSNDMIKFHTYGRQFAPKGWPITNRPYVNRLYCIYGGTAYFVAGTEEHRLKPKHLYVFPHHIEFRVRQEDNDPLDHMFFDFAIIPPFIFREFIEMHMDDDSLIGHTASALSCLFTQYGEKGSDPDFPKLVKSYFENLLLLVCREKKLAQLSDIRLITILEYIHNNFEKPVSTREMSALANLEENYFIRVFKQAMTITPYQYLREYRLNMALSCLESGMTVSETALKVGYENTSSFSNAMKKSRGFYPSEILQSSAG